MKITKNPQIYNNNIRFEGKDKTKKFRTKEDNKKDSFQSSKLSKAAKIGIAAGILSGIAALVLFAKSSKGKEIINKIKSYITMPESKSVNSNNNYTGTIEKINKKGQKITLTYENGKLKASNIDNKIEKFYTYKNEGSINTREVKIYKNKNLVKTSRIIKSDKRMDIHTINHTPQKEEKVISFDTTSRKPKLVSVKGKRINN